MRSVCLLLALLCSSLVAHCMAFDDDFMLKYPPSMFQSANGNAAFNPSAFSPISNPYQTYSEADVQFGGPVLQQQQPQPQLQQQQFGLPSMLPDARFMSERVDAPPQVVPDGHAVVTTTQNGVTKTQVAPGSGSSSSGSSSSSSSSADSENSEESQGRKHVVTTTTTTITKKLHPAGQSEDDTDTSNSASTNTAKEKEEEAEKLELEIERQKARAEVAEERLAEAKDREKEKQDQLKRAREHLLKRLKKHGEGKKHHESSNSESGSSDSESENSSSSSSDSESGSESGSSSDSSSDSEQQGKCKGKKKKVTLRVTVSEEDNDDDCEAYSASNTEMKHMKGKLDELTNELKQKLQVYNSEHNWFNKALELIKNLRTKAVNVKLHLKDLNKDIHHIAVERNHVEDEFSKLKKDLAEDRRYKALQDAMEKLLSDADQVKGEINSLSHKKSNYLQKVQEIQQTLQELKAKRDAEKNRVNGGLVVAQQVSSLCPCHLPASLRTCACS